MTTKEELALLKKEMEDLRAEQAALLAQLLTMQRLLRQKGLL